MLIKQWFLKWAGAACMASLSLGVLAQGAFPDKPLKIVVPFGAGGVAYLTALELWPKS
jgi:tripartite-type tricarboxylate transporter receptor subunit TctC